MAGAMSAVPMADVRRCSPSSARGIAPGWRAQRIDATPRCVTCDPRSRRADHAAFARHTGALRLLKASPKGEGVSSPRGTLKHTRWCFLERKENRTINQRRKLREVLRYPLRTVRALLLKESFQCFWAYKRATWAGWFLDKWCTRAMRLQLEPMKRVAKMLRSHRAKLAIRKARGFRTYEALEPRSITSLATYPSHNSPTDVVDEARFHAAAVQERGRPRRRATANGGTRRGPTCPGW